MKRKAYITGRVNKRTLLYRKNEKNLRLLKKALKNKDNIEASFYLREMKSKGFTPPGLTISKDD